MSDRADGKRRRGAQMQRRADGRGTAPRPTAAGRSRRGPSRCPGVPWLVAGSRSRSSPSSRSSSSAGHRRRGRRRPAGARPARRPAAAAAGACPTSQPPALPAGETRTVTMNTPKGDDRHQARGRPVADRGRQLRRARVVRLLRRHRLPPDGRRSQDGTPFVIQGGDPTGTGSGGPGLHDPGRAGHGAVRARHGRDGPDARSPTRSARSSSSSSTTRRATSSPGTTPTRSSAT